MKKVWIVSLLVLILLATTFLTVSGQTGDQQEADPNVTPAEKAELSIVDAYIQPGQITINQQIPLSVTLLVSLGPNTTQTVTLPVRVDLAVNLDIAQSATSVVDISGLGEGAPPVASPQQLVFLSMKEVADRREDIAELSVLDIDRAISTPLAEFEDVDIFVGPPLLFLALPPYDWSPNGSEIVFVGNNVEVPDLSDLYLMRADGSGRVNLTDDLDVQSSPRWSPEGSKIAFVSGDGFDESNIHVINADGSDQTNLTANLGIIAMNPHWSPDGSKIAFGTIDEDNHISGIYVMEADGSGQTSLTSSSTILQLLPHWSPNGSKIAYVTVDEEEETVDIHVMNADGSGQTKLINAGLAGDEEEAFFLFGNGLLAWSPDGSKIAFVSNRGDNNDIYVMDADGSDLVRLTTSPLIDSFPAWSPDGSQIAFMSGDIDLREGEIRFSSLKVMNADGSAKTELASQNFTLLIAPIWRP